MSGLVGDFEGVKDTGGQGALVEREAGMAPGRYTEPRTPDADRRARSNSPVIVLTIDHLMEGKIDGETPDWLTITSGRADVVGARLSLPEIYAYHTPSLVVLGTSAASLLEAVRELGGPLTISPFGISNLLHHGLVPPPHTEWQEMTYLGIGDRMSFTAGSTGIEWEVDRDIVFIDENSTGTSVPDTRKLLDLLTDATDRELEDAGGTGFLMMSSGKDSVSVAVALAEGGHSDVPCVTYRADSTNTENEVAAAVCRKLGLQHSTIDLPVGNAVVEEQLIRFFEGSPRPSGDLAQIPYVLTAAAVDPKAGAVFDGSGNDPYMGFVTSPKRRLKLGLRVRGHRMQHIVQRAIPIESSLNYFNRSRLTAMFPGRTFRAVDTKQFYADAIDTEPWWRATGEEMPQSTMSDLGTGVMTRYLDQAQVHLKIHVAAEAFGVTAKLPWADPAVVDYFFNLPIEDRYDPKTGVTKILLRRMLMETIDYDAAAVGKHFFLFDGAEFLLRHRDFVMSEITGCALWTDDIVSLASSWFDRLRRKPMLHHSLLTLFQVSGWYNHSRYVERPKGPG